MGIKAVVRNVNERPPRKRGMNEAMSGGGVLMHNKKLCFVYSGMRVLQCYLPHLMKNNISEDKTRIHFIISHHIVMGIMKEM